MNSSPSGMNDPAPPHAYMMKMRDLNMETSLAVFVGPYLSPRSDRRSTTDIG